MSDIVTFFRTACLPAQVYFALLLLNIAFAFFGKFSKDSKLWNVFIGMFVVTILIGLAFTWFANYLCVLGWEPVAWLVVLLPLTTLVVNLRKLTK